MTLPPRTRTSRLWTIAAAVLFLVTALTGWALYANWSFGGRLAAIRAAGDPASLAELAPKPIPPDEDAAATLESVAARIKSFGKDHGAFYKSPIGKTYDQRNDGEPLTPEQAAAIKAILNNYKDLDDAIAKAAACQRYASRLPFDNWSIFQTEQLEAVRNIRAVARFLNWQTEIATSEGRTADAVEKGMEQLRLAKLFESEPLLISRLVVEAVRNGAAPRLYDALASGKISNHLHGELDTELARHDDTDTLIQTLKKERAYSITALDEQSGRMGRLVINTIGWRVKSMHNGVLDWYDELLPVIGKPWYEFQADPAAKRVFQTPTGFGTLTDLLLPSVQASYEAANRTTAIMRSLRIFNAIQNYAEKNGRDPSGLADLRLPAKATIDPFSGKPLILKHTDDGWIVYSVGRDGQDDGGVLKDLKDCGVGPPKAR
jgi:hypothetical protein